MNEPILPNRLEECSFTDYIDSLIQEGYLTSKVSGRGTKYYICDQQKVESSDPTVVPIKTRRNLKFSELESQILSIGTDCITVEEIAIKVNKNFNISLIRLFRK